MNRLTTTPIFSPFASNVPTISFMTAYLAFFVVKVAEIISILCRFVYHLRPDDIIAIQGQNAMGLTGADMNVIRSKRRAPKKVRMDDGTEQEVDFGFVGDPVKADGAALSHLIEAGVIPVIAPLTHDGEGNILNTNADTMASTVAVALASLYDVTLIYSFEKKGVLMNPDDDDSVIPVINRQSYEQYVNDGVISGGMMPKIENALQAVDKGVSKVVITLATQIDGEHGTAIVNA